MRAIALSLLFASGCQAPMQLHQLKQPWFAMGQADQPVPAAAASRPASAAGQLTVRFDGELARLGQARRIQATVSEVEKVVVTVLPQGGVAVSKTVLKADLTGGQTTVTFDGLPPGDATVTITAYDVDGANLGTTVKSVAIVAGQVADLAVPLQLNPTYVVGGGSSGGPTSGGLAANVTLADGFTITGSGSSVPTLASTFSHEYWGCGLAVDPQGNVWMGATRVLPDERMAGGLVKFSPTGEVLAQLTFDSEVMDIEIDAQGYVWLVTEVNREAPLGDLFRVAPDGTITESFVVNWGVKSLALDSQGRAWVNDLGIPRRYSINQAAPEVSMSPGGAVIDLAIDSQDRVWLLTASGLECRNQDGSLVRTIASPSAHAAPYGPYGLTIDNQDNVWVLDPDQTLRKFGPNGDSLGTWSGFGATSLLIFGFNSQLLMADPSGGVWVRNPDALVKLNANGTEVSRLTFSVERPTGGLAVGPSGLWMSYGPQVHHFTF
jgi:sugar lactone lactonase YvrE